MAEQLDVRSCRCEDLEGDRRRPREEEAKILPTRLQRSSAVARKESDRSEFRFVHFPLNDYPIEPEPPEGRGSLHRTPSVNPALFGRATSAEAGAAPQLVCRIDRNPCRHHRAGSTRLLR